MFYVYNNQQYVFIRAQSDYNLYKAKENPMNSITIPPKKEKAEVESLSNAIGKRLKLLRKEKGWTLGHLGDLLGITGPGVSNWEQGIRTPSFSTLIELANLYETSATWIAGFNDYNGPEGYVLPQSVIPLKRQSVKITHAAETTAMHSSYLRSRGMSDTKITSINPVDDSMAPLIYKNDELLIDRSRATVIDSDIFAFLVNERVWIRWIFPELDGTFTVHAENSAKYPDQKLSEDALKQLRIVGRVARILRDR